MQNQARQLLDSAKGALENVDEALFKPLMRGWSHAAAAVISIMFTVLICWLSHDDLPRMISMLVFGTSMIMLYTVSATYHIGHWRKATRRVLDAFDHINIFFQIAGTYTPICFNVLTGTVRILVLTGIWFLALLGFVFSVFMYRYSRWLSAILYIGMGWISLIMAPRLVRALPITPLVLLLLGGISYTIGAIIYAARRPNPFPKVFGFHEIFHLFVIAGGTLFAIVMWLWVLPYPRA